jgi:hypothetical protein
VDVRRGGPANSECGLMRDSAFQTHLPPFTARNLHITFCFVNFEPEARFYFLLWLYLYFSASYISFLSI